MARKYVSAKEEKMDEDGALGGITIIIIAIFIWQFILFVDFTDKDVAEEFEDVDYCEWKYGVEWKDGYDNEIGYGFCSTISDDGKLTTKYRTRNQFEEFKEITYCNERHWFKLDDC